MRSVSRTFTFDEDDEAGWTLARHFGELNHLEEVRITRQVRFEYAEAAPITVVQWWESLGVGAEVRAARDGVPIYAAPDRARPADNPRARGQAWTVAAGYRMHLVEPPKGGALFGWLLVHRGPTLGELWVRAEDVTKPPT